MNWTHWLCIGIGAVVGAVGSFAWLTWYLRRGIWS